MFDRVSFKLLAAIFFSGTLGLSGCGSMRSYDSELKQTVGLASAGSLDGALADLDKNNTGDNKDLLYYFERGELLRLKGDYQASNSAWQSADAKVEAWEEAARADINKVLGHVGSVLVNDKTRVYDGYDYEKVLLTARIAMNHVANGDWDAARIEIKKTHEREAIIARVRERKYEAAEKEASGSKGVKMSYTELKGYPVETLDAPEVLNLKNAYQNAFSHYLAGFVYEALGDKSLAAPGYRQAIELRPELTSLRSALDNLDGRRAAWDGLTDVLFVVESGNAPALDSVSVPIPVPYGGTLGVIPLSFPVIRSDTTTSIPSKLLVNGTANVSLSHVTSVDTMARRNLKDEMPSIIARSTARAVVKAIAQKEAYDRGGLLAGLVATVATTITESADERTWRTLPANISIGRAKLPPGRHELRVDLPTGQKTFSVDVGGQYALAALRLMGAQAYIMQAKVPEPQRAAQMQLATEPKVQNLGTAQASDDNHSSQSANTKKTAPKKSKVTKRKTITTTTTGANP